MELGLATFADLSSGVSPEQRMSDLIEEAVLADQLGLDVFAIGEHHRPDFLISSPAVALAAVAARTERIRLSSAVTVLSSDDPVRVFQQFAELDLISGGRAEIMAGRGSFIESFPLFGYDLDDYDELYAEKLDLLLKIRASTSVDWSGRLRAPLHGAGVWPRPVQDPLPVWVAVGGSPQSVVRAGTLGLPLTLAIIGGQPERFAPLVALYRRAAAEAGHDAEALPLAINTHAFVGETSAAADSAFAAPYLAMMNRIGRERGWPPLGPRRVRGAALAARRGRRRLARAGGREDPVRARAVRQQPLRRADERRRGQARRRPALDGAVRDRGGPGRAGRGRPAHRGQPAAHERLSAGARVPPRGRFWHPACQTSKPPRSSSDQALVQRERGPGGRVPRVRPGRRGQRCRAQRLAGRRVADQLGQGGARARRIAGRHEPRRALGGDLGEAADVADHGGAPEGQRRGQHAREVEALGPRVGQHDHVGAAK